MAGQFAEFRGKRTGRDDGADPWHRKRDCCQHAAAQFAEACRWSGIFEVDAGHGVQATRERLGVRVRMRNDGKGVLAYAGRMK